MTTMPEWWQIVVLTLLTLTVIGILRRTVTLIVMARTPNLYGQILNQTSANEQSQNRGSSHVSRSDSYVSDPTPETWVGDMMVQDAPDLIGSAARPVDDLRSGVLGDYDSHMRTYRDFPPGTDSVGMATGGTPSGVSYSPSDVASLVHRPAKPRRRIRTPRWLGGKHPHA